MHTQTHLALSLIATLLFSSLTDCGGGGGNGDHAGANAGATIHLAWDPSPDPTVSAYDVHYGKRSPGQPRSCTYSDSMRVSAPLTTVTGLDPNTRYYFAVSAYNGLSGPCSNEVSTVTLPSQDQATP
jgi:Fibronectin type III domain